MTYLMGGWLCIPSESRILQVAIEQYKEVPFAIDSAQKALQLLMDPEARVRTAAGHSLGSAAEIAGLDIWNLAEKPILEVVHFCWASLSKASQLVGPDIRK